MILNICYRSRRSDGFFIDDRSLDDIGNYDFVNGPEAALALSSKLGGGCNATLPISPDHIRQVRKLKKLKKGLDNECEQHLGDQPLRMLQRQHPGQAVDLLHALPLPLHCGVQVSEDTQ